MQETLGSKVVDEYASLAMRIFQNQQLSGSSKLLGSNNDLGSTEDATPRVCVATGAPIPENAGRASFSVPAMS